MSRVVSMRVQEHQFERLNRLARRLGKTPSETGALLMEEGLRRSDFAYLDFRDSPVGRQACVQGSGLAVWEVVHVARSCGMDPARTAEHLGWPLPKVKAALLYAEAYPEEVEQAIQDNEALDFQAVSRMLPGAEEFRIPAGEKG